MSTSKAFIRMAAGGIGCSSNRLALITDALPLASLFLSDICLQSIGSFSDLLSVSDTAVVLD